MAKFLPNEKAELVKTRVYVKAEKFGYSNRSRTENNQFLDSLVEDVEIGGVVLEYMAKENVRTYIKDGILNAYAKQLTKNSLDKVSPTDTIQRIYGVSSSVIQQGTGKNEWVSVSRSDDGRIFVVSGGTVLKWETALRKALELIAKQSGLSVDGKTPEICLQLVVKNNSLTEVDRTYILTALDAIGVKAIFCND